MSWHRHSPALLFTHLHRWQAQLVRLAARKAPCAQMTGAQLWFPNSSWRRFKSCWVQPKVWCFPTMCTKEEVKIQEMQYWKWKGRRVCMQTITRYKLRVHWLNGSISCIVLLYTLFRTLTTLNFSLVDWWTAETARSCQQQRMACAAQNARPKPRIANI